MENRTPSCSRTAGFTLMEVLVAIGVAAILTAVAAPNLSGFQSQYRLSGVSNQIAFDIGRARMQAVGQNVSMRVVLVGGTGYRFERSSNGTTFIPDGVTVRLPSGVRIWGDTSTTFTRTGIATAPTTINITTAAGTKVIRTNVIGRVSVT